MTSPKKTKQLFTIGDLARELDITTRTIRYYEERGFLAPQRTGPAQQRIYTQKDRGRLKLLLRAKGLGFRLDDIKELFVIYDAAPNEQGQYRQFIRLREMIIRRIAQIDEQQAELNYLREELLDRLEEVNEGIKRHSELGDDHGGNKIPGG